MPGQQSILVDDSGCPYITAFGSAIVAPDQVSVPLLETDRRFATGFAPEILTGKGTLSKEADVFSFAMVMVVVRLTAGNHRGSTVDRPLHPDTGFHRQDTLSLR